MLPYSSYEKLKKTCIILNSKSRCYKEYIRRSFACCDVFSVPTKSLAMLIKEEEKLKLEREAAFRSAIKSIARVNRL